MVEQHIFVARQQELERLAALLKKSINCEGQICFVTGRRGSERQP